MRHRLLVTLLSLFTMIAVLAAPTLAGDGDEFEAELEGFQEVPAVSTTGEGKFKAEVTDDTIAYELEYSGLEADAFAAHIHLGQTSVNGGVIAFLCGGGDKPPCPARSGTVTGVIDPADVIGPSSQGIAPGEFDEVLTALEEGVVYANVHTSKHPGGEIRGQVA